MRSRLWFLLAISGLAMVLTAAAKDPVPNTLSKREKKAGWRLLFDGRSLQGWKLYGKPGLPTNTWEVADGTLHLPPNDRMDNIITTEKFTDYELTWDWKVAPKGNNGIKYLVDEANGSVPGPEYQMVDDSTMTTNPVWQTASLYDVIPPATNKVLHPPGQWNHSRLLVQGKHVEHWLNGRLTVTYELESPELKALVAKSKFKNAATYGKKIPGHILLTAHHDEAWYRNLKLRPLPAP